MLIINITIYCLVSVPIFVGTRPLGAIKQATVLGILLWAGKTGQNLHFLKTMQNWSISKWASREPNLSDFMDMEVHRVGDSATVIFDYIEGKPCRLIGFVAKSDKTDFDIREEAFYHYQMLRERYVR